MLLLAGGVTVSLPKQLPALSFRLHSSGEMQRNPHAHGKTMWTPLFTLRGQTRMISYFFKEVSSATFIISSLGSHLLVEKNLFEKHPSRLPLNMTFENLLEIVVLVHGATLSTF